MLDILATIKKFRTCLRIDGSEVARVGIVTLTTTSWKPPFVALPAVGVMVSVIGYNVLGSIVAGTP